MNGIDADLLPVGFVRLDADGFIVEANLQFRLWADCDAPEGHLPSDFLVPVDDFLDAGTSLRMVARSNRPDRAAFVIAGEDGLSLTVVDASERYAAGRALRAAQDLADRTQRRLQLVIDSSIAFAKATNEQKLADILATTAAGAYRAEEATVYLADEKERLYRAAGANPFEELSDAGSRVPADFGMHEVVKISGEREASEVSSHLAEMMRATGVQSVIAAPLHLDGDVLGVFVCFFHHPRQFDDEATPLAEALAGQASQALTSLRLQNQLEHAATHDKTTGLPNRRRLEAGLVGEAIENLAVMFIDLDGFKAVNDSLGHDQGDEVLREVARRLQSAVRQDDVVIRYGGDEFVVTCNLKTAATVSELADRIRFALQSPYPGLLTELSISASVGVATGATTAGAASADSLIRMADQAMYKAKLTGGDRVVRA